MPCSDFRMSLKTPVPKIFITPSKYLGVFSLLSIFYGLLTKTVCSYSYAVVSLVLMGTMILSVCQCHVME